MAVVFVGDLFLSLGVMPSLIFIFSASLDGFVALPSRGVGVSFEEPHLRLMFWFVESGFPLTSHMFACAAHQSGPVLWYYFE